MNDSFSAISRSENDTPESRRDVSALKCILSAQPKLYVNIIGQPHIEIPFEAGVKKTFWHLNHNRVCTEISGYIWDKLGFMLYRNELNRMLDILESRAWKNQQTDIELSEAIDDDPLFECLMILLFAPNSEESVNLTATRLLDKLDLCASRNRIDIRQQAWPKGAAQLSRRIGELIPILEKVRIAVTRGRNSGGIRFIQLSRAPPCDDAVPIASQHRPINQSHYPKPNTPVDAGDADSGGIFSKIERK